MVQILPCPECQKTTVLPDKTSLEATLKCPTCEEQFVLGEVLTSHFPRWEVLSDPGAKAFQGLSNSVEGRYADDGAAGGSQVAGSQSGAVSNGVSLARGTAEDDGELRLADAPDLPRRRSSGGKTDWANFKPITYDEYEKMKRDSSSPIWTVVQVVLGGLAAIPIGLIFIWHLGGSDVAGAGPFVGRYVPWIVPEKFRPPEDEEELEDEDSSSPPARGESGFRQFDDVMPLENGKATANSSEVNEASETQAPDSGNTPAEAVDSAAGPMTVNNTPSSSSEASASIEPPSEPDGEDAAEKPDSTASSDATSDSGSEPDESAKVSESDNSGNSGTLSPPPLPDPPQ